MTSVKKRIRGQTPKVFVPNLEKKYDRENRTKAKYSEYQVLLTSFLQLSLPLTGVKHPSYFENFELLYTDNVLFF